MGDGAEETVRAYYDALRDGEPLGPFFAGEEDAVKFGISERLVGGDEIEAGLADQTAHTTDWAVESRALRVTERECHAWFSDDVRMAWTDTRQEVDYDFDSRWSGTLERRPEATIEDGGPPTDWRFVGMHVSTAGAIE